jgi:hypothetical protein
MQSMSYMRCDQEEQVQTPPPWAPANGARVVLTMSLLFPRFKYPLEPLIRLAGAECVPSHHESALLAAVWVCLPVSDSLADGVDD